jgi:hypothetical protein
MKRVTYLILLVTSFVCAGFASANYSSYTCPVGSEHVTLDLKDARVADVFKFMEELAGLEFVLDPCVEGRITLKLENTPLETVLAAMLNSLDLECFMTGNVCEITCRRKIEETPPQAEEFKNSRIRMNVRIEEVQPDGSRKVAARVDCETVLGRSCSMRKGSQIQFRDMDAGGNIYMRMGNGGFTVEIIPFIETAHSARLRALITLVERDEEHDTTIKSTRVVDTTAEVGGPHALLAFIPSTNGGGIEIYYLIEEIVTG